MPKATIRLATGQYCYVEFQVEGTPEDVLAEYTRISKLYAGPAIGLPGKEFNDCLDKYLTEGKMDSHCYENMSTEQKMLCQDIKRAFARIKARNDNA